MANYIVTENNFKPYTFEELIKPYLMYEEAYKEQENAIDKTLDEVAIWDKLKNSSIEGDRTLYNSSIKPYMDELLRASGDLSTNGLSPSLRESIKRTSRGLKVATSPLEKLEELRNEELKAQNAIRNSGRGNAYFTHDATTSSLLDYTNGPVAWNSLTDEQIIKMAEDITSNLSSGVQKTDTLPYTNNDPFIKRVVTSGFSPEDMQAILEGADNETYKYIKDTVINSLGLDNFGVLNVDNIIKSGIKSGNKQQRSESFVNNPDYMTSYQKHSLQNAQDAAWGKVEDMEIDGEIVKVRRWPNGSIQNIKTGEWIADKAGTHKPTSTTPETIEDALVAFGGGYDKKDFNGHTVEMTRKIEPFVLGLSVNGKNIVKTNFNLDQRGFDQNTINRLPWVFKNRRSEKVKSNTEFGYPALNEFITNSAELDTNSYRLLDKYVHDNKETLGLSKGTIDEFFKYYTAVSLTNNSNAGYQYMYMSKAYWYDYQNNLAQQEKPPKLDEDGGNGREGGSSQERDKGGVGAPTDSTGIKNPATIKG